MPERFLSMIAVTLLGLALSVNAMADDTDEAILTSLLNDFLAGASRGDVTVHERLWADDLVYTSSNGTRTTKQAILESMRASASDIAETPAVIYTAEDISIRLYDDSAVVAFRLVATPQLDTEASVMHYFNTGTFLKRGGEWRAVAWQATIIPTE